MGLGGEREGEIYPSPRQKTKRASRAFKSILTALAKGIGKLFYVLCIAVIAVCSYLLWRIGRSKRD